MGLIRKEEAQLFQHGFSLGRFVIRDRANMKTGKMSIPDASGMTPVFQQLVSLFERRGWLNQTLRIKYRDKRYRICCNGQEFFAYRINDHWGVSHGYPGWPVCIVNPDQMIEDSDLSAFESTEPSARGWLRCLTEGDFETI